MPKVSVIAIALDESKFAPLYQSLAAQTWQDFEFIGEVGSSTSETWNRAIQRAGGDILVFLDADARPLNEKWLGELVAGVTDKRTIVKGLEITSSPLDPSSLAGYKQVFVRHPFDERFLWAEDTELFCRLQEAGYRFVQLESAPVIHISKSGSKTYMRRAFRYGLYMARLRHRYGKTVELMSISFTCKLIIRTLLNLLGMLFSYLIYWPWRKSY